MSKGAVGPCSARPLVGGLEACLPGMFLQNRLPETHSDTFWHHIHTYTVKMVTNLVETTRMLEFNSVLSFS